jgi:diaminohydroxyphosphoribosylaminopyrimidine deaminase/5-amino-6-(5-phosphoribosylamino)uracil reductase
MQINELYMLRCLNIARNGVGFTAPNPVVGSVIICDDKIIGEGFHRRFGEAHAEVNAITSVKDKALLKKSTLYVSLEPCSHFGKTPPCAELIIRSGIPRVVIACLDPFPKVAGRGVEMLRQAGIEVVTGVLEKEATELNKYFITAHQKQRPYIILKWAQSGDGFIDKLRTDSAEKPVKLSNEITQIMLHKLRSEVQAIMIGTNTAILDNPELTVRHWAGKAPLRIVIDRNLRISSGHSLLNGTTSTLVITNQNRFKEKKNVEYLYLENSPQFLAKLMAKLYERGINSLLAEGGANLHNSLINEDLWDEMRIETTGITLENGVHAAGCKNCKNMQLVEKINIPSSSFRIKQSILDIYRHF